MRQIDRPPSLAEAVLERLRADIVRGDLPLGQLLSERVLAEKMGVSKTPVREALAQLRSEGLVRIVPQRGAFVFSLSASEVRAICEYRLVLETAALKLTMAREPKALADDLARVINRMERARKAGDREAYLNADTAFHAAFFEHCGNSYFSEVIRASRRQDCCLADPPGDEAAPYREIIRRAPRDDGIVAARRTRPSAARARHPHRPHEIHLCRRHRRHRGCGRAPLTRLRDSRQSSSCNSAHGPDAGRRRKPLTANGVSGLTLGVDLHSNGYGQSPFTVAITHAEHLGPRGITQPPICC